MVARFLTRGLTPSRIKATLYSRALSRALLKVRTSPLALSRSPTLANSICARLPSRAGEAEGPHPLAALAYDEIEPAAIGMDASLQQFNLVRIERHFTLPC